jgi:hypothetical protein
LATETYLNGNSLSTHYQRKLVERFSSFDGVGVEQTIGEILAEYSLETIADKLFGEIIRYFERQWHKGEISLSVHNYTVTTLRSYLLAMMKAAVMPSSGPKVLLSCAPGDLHEIGLILLGLSLRRRGCIVIYLGPDLVVSEFDQILEKSQPQIVCVSAATIQSVQNLQELVKKHQKLLSLDSTAKKSAKLKPLFTFGGGIFVQNPACISTIPGVYLGDTVNTAVTKVQKLLTI